MRRSSSSPTPSTDSPRTSRSNTAWATTDQRDARLARGAGRTGPVSMDQCVLCLRRDRPMTREHVFAHWLVIKLHASRLVPSNGPADRIGRVVTTVCADCNAGWMSSLEVSFRRILFGAPPVGVLQEPDPVAPSRWFAKTAILVAQRRAAA